MKRLAQQAILSGLARRLTKAGSWTGETHIQKAAYLLSELFKIDFDFDFILYKHGPFSFELRDELAMMRADGLLEGFAPSPRYGQQLIATPRGEELEERFEKTMQHYGPSLDWIATQLGGRGVMELERLATAMWMTREQPQASVKARAEAVIGVKPHIPIDDAIESVEEIDRLRASQLPGSVRQGE